MMKRSFCTYTSFLSIALGSLASCISVWPVPVSASATPNVAARLSGNLNSPANISEKLQQALTTARKSSVSVFANGYASGVIISKDGYVLTAAHVLKPLKGEKKDITITLDDGRVFKATNLGHNIETDFGLLKINNLDGKKISACRIAKNSPRTGDFIFTHAHPSGILKGRPAQTRLGRVTSIREKEGKPLYLFSDLNIQPGDSGGPLFNLKGELIGINSSAASHINFNIFSAIEQFHQDRDRLEKSEKWGDPKKAPTSGDIFQAKFSKEVIAKVQAELLRRAQSHHYQTTDFVRKFVNDKGEAKIDANAMINFMAKDSIAIAQGQQVSMGLDDPAIVKHLKQKPTGFIPFHISNGSKTLSKATAIDSEYLVAKASLLATCEKPMLVLKSGNQELLKVSEDKSLDLVLLKISTPSKIPSVTFPRNTIPVSPGQALRAPDRFGSPLWNVATDTRRAVSKKRSTGPMKDKDMISKHRAPYPEAIRHSLPLYAADAGSPVFDLKGNFVGIHIARFSRTMGLIIPHEKVKDFFEKHRHNVKIPKS